MLFDLISELARPHFAQLLEEAPIALDDLRGRVQQHASELQQAGGAVDVELAAQLADSCLGLIDSLSDFSGDTSRKLVQAACMYFVLEDDASPDSSEGGLIDDAEVVNAVATHLDLERLVIRLQE